MVEFWIQVNPIIRQQEMHHIQLTLKKNNDVMGRFHSEAFVYGLQVPERNIKKLCKLPMMIQLYDDSDHLKINLQVIMELI